MSKLGYTWYPKDFASDPEVMLMTSSERGVYRDLIDLAYQTENNITYSVEALSRYTNGSIQDIENVLKIKGEKTSKGWKIPSCDKRLEIVNRNRNNGKNGGRPKKQETQTKPKQNPNLEKIEPKHKGKEKEKEKEKEKYNLLESVAKNSDELFAARKKKFYESLIPFIGRYGKEMIRDFYEYWTEPNRSGSKFKQEMQSTWSLERRLRIWAGREDFGKKQNQSIPRNAIDARNTKGLFGLTT